MGYVIDDPIAPPAPEVAAVLQKAIDALGRAGAQLQPGWPVGLQPKALLNTYVYMLMAFTASMAPVPSNRRSGKNPPIPAIRFKRGSLATYSEWQRANLRRLAYSGAMAGVFQ